MAIIGPGGRLIRRTEWALVTSRPEANLRAPSRRLGNVAARVGLRFGNCAPGSLRRACVFPKLYLQCHFRHSRAT